MKEITDTLKHLARRYHSRWDRFDGALERLRANDDGGRSSEGEQARRMLANAFRMHNYPASKRNAVATDRLNAIRKLGRPLAEALGHIITIELADEMLVALTNAERDRDRQRCAAEDVEWVDAPYGRLITALHAHGVNRGNYSVLDDEEIAAIAKYIRRKVERRRGTLPPIRTDPEMRRGGGRKHPFWDPYHLPPEGGDPRRT